MIESQNYTLGRGELYFDNGNGERYLGNTTEFNLSTATETLEHYSSDRGLRNRDRSIVTQITYSGSTTTDNIIVENLAMLFLGESTTVSQGSLTGEVDTFVGVKGYNWYQLGTDAANPAGKRDVSNVTVTGAGGTPSYVEGTDFELDAALGRLQVLRGGAITDDSDIDVTYDVAAYSIEQVVSGDSQVRGKLRYVAFNPDGAGKQMDYFMPSVTLSANGDFALKAEQDWQAIPFSVEISKTDTEEAVYVQGRPFTP